MAPPVLVCTTHDPGGVVLDLATDEALNGVLGIFRSCVIACSAETDRRAEQALTRAGVSVIRQDGGRLDLYRAALRAGAASSGHLLYADFDRLLHWQRSYSAELRQIAPLVPGWEVTVFGRTKRAFDTHPACQRLTEGPVNELFRHLFRAPATSDIFASCWGLSKRAATYLLDAPVAPSTAFYVLWPALLLRQGFDVEFRAVEGLEWETPDAHAGEIGLLGYDSWLERFESRRQWSQRAEMSAQWVTELLRLAVDGPPKVRP